MLLKIGCCGFPSGMKNYIQKFDLVEVQNTFYKPPKLDTAKKWKELAPKNFEFAIKAWQLITHLPSSPTYKKVGIIINENKLNHYGFFRPTIEVFEAWNVIKDIGKILKTKIILFQCPPNFQPSRENIENMKQFFSSIKGFRFVWEPRGNWKNEQIKLLCEELNLIHCVDPFGKEPVTKDFTYFRLHGAPPGKEMYKYQYSKNDLQYLASKCKNHNECYCLFNNITMYEDALQFKEMLK